MNRVDDVELARAQRQAEEILKAADALGRFFGRCRAKLRRAFAAPPEQWTAVSQLLYQAYIGPQHRR